jgi:hypothetical protein
MAGLGEQRSSEDAGVFDFLYGDASLFDDDAARAEWRMAPCDSKRDESGWLR